MLKPFAAILFLLPLAAQAETEVLATLSATSGSLPPTFAWTIEVTVSTTGWVTVTRCAGDETEGPACKTGAGAAGPDGVPGILRAAKASLLVDRPATAIDPPMVGGGLTTGSVILGDHTITLIAQPVEEDEPRVTAVLGAIFNAIPEDLRPILKGD